MYNYKTKWLTLTLNRQAFIDIYVYVDGESFVALSVSFVVESFKSHGSKSLNVYSTYGTFFVNLGNITNRLAGYDSQSFIVTCSDIVL